MKYRFTIKELKENNDLWVIQAILNERKNNLTNQYSPLSERLGEILKKIEDKKEEIENMLNPKF